jgi:hypothetical protein
MVYFSFLLLHFIVKEQGKCNNESVFFPLLSQLPRSRSGLTFERGGLQDTLRVRLFSGSARLALKSHSLAPA